jgi:large conductance mechanosensitive channel
VDPVGKLASLGAHKKVFSFFDEFKRFALKGNVIDMAVGVVIGAAFGKIIDSLVKHLIMPLLGLLLPGEQGYLGWKWVVGGKEVPSGLFLGEVVNFLIVALALFIFVVKFIGLLTRLRKTEAAAPPPPPPPPPPPSREQELLAEIRDLLKQRTA